MKKYSLLAICTGLAIFTASAVATRLIHASPFPAQVILKLILAVLSIAVARSIFKVPFSQFSLKGKTGKTGKYKLLALLTGMVTSAIMLLLHIPGIPLLKQLAFWQYIVAVWFVSSICEEIFARGMVQGIVQQHETNIQQGIPLSVWTGAITFSLIHFSIYIVGGNLSTCLLIMAATFLLGLQAGMAKLKGNLLSAIYVHILFNVGALLGGAIVNIIAKLTTGHLLVTPN